MIVKDSTLEWRSKTYECWDQIAYTYIYNVIWILETKLVWIE